jgi:predicted nucleic acid-binding protein
VNVYLDATVLVALFMNDAQSARADSLLRARPYVLIISDFGVAEYAAAIARLVRTGEIPQEEARIAFSAFDAWSSDRVRRVDSIPADVRAAEAFVRRLDLSLRAPDAINIAIATRLGAALMTFDDGMAKCARALGAEVFET